MCLSQNIQFKEDDPHFLPELSAACAASEGVRRVRGQEDPASTPLSLAPPLNSSYSVPEYMEESQYLLCSTSYPPLNNPPNSTGVEEKLPGFPAALCLLWSST